MIDGYQITGQFLADRARRRNLTVESRFGRIPLRCVILNEHAMDLTPDLVSREQRPFVRWKSLTGSRDLKPPNRKRVDGFAL